MSKKGKAKHEGKKKDGEKSVAVVSAGEPVKLGNKEYTKELRKLQAGLFKLQEWVKHKAPALDEAPL